jgi:hypothetical protein
VSHRASLDRARKEPRPLLALAAVGALLLAACSDRPPAVLITEAPPASEGGPDRTAQISGSVHGAQSGDAIVLFAKSGLWYVQPFQLKPFTAIREDSTWSASTHFGSEYAAVMVRKGYQPPLTLEALPDVGGPVIAVARVKGMGEAPRPGTRTVSFSGYDWTVRQAQSDRGGSNQYGPGNVRVDGDGALHLSITDRDGTWTSAEVSLTRTLGYGTYTFSVRNTAQLDPAALLTFYTYDESGPAENFREMAILIQRPDSRDRLNGRYVVQPNYLAANVARFGVPSGTVTHSLQWEPGRVVFATNPGGRPTLHASGGAHHEFIVGVPSAGQELVRMALIYLRSSPKPPQRNVEVVVERFQHFP